MSERSLQLLREEFGLPAQPDMLESSVRLGSKKDPAKVGRASVGGDVVVTLHVHRHRSGAVFPIRLDARPDQDHDAERQQNHQGGYVERQRPACDAIDPGVRGPRREQVVLQSIDEAVDPVPLALRN